MSLATSRRENNNDANDQRFSCPLHIQVVIVRNVMITSASRMKRATIDILSTVTLLIPSTLVPAGTSMPSEFATNASRLRCHVGQQAACWRLSREPDVSAIDRLRAVLLLRDGELNLTRRLRKPVD
jgi:hypothetical protein